MTTPYTTIAPVKVKLGITDTSADATLTSLILQVSAAVDTFVFGPVVEGFLATADVVEFHDGGMDGIVLNRLVTDDAGGERDAIVVLEDGITLVQDTDFSIDEFPSNTIRKLDQVADAFRAVFTAGHRNVKVTYRPAYSVVPNDIERVTEEETARAYLAANTDSGDGGFLVVTQRTPDAGTVLTYRGDAFSQQSLDVLNGYKQRLRFH